MTRNTIDVNHIARIEGHGNVHVVIEGGEVRTVEMNIVEPARLFESMVRGRSYSEISYISSRICGICSASHVVTDLKAIERIFGVRVSERTERLRDLLLYGSYLQNHGAHLFVFATPDFIGQPSVFPLQESDPELLEQALGLKRLGNELCTRVGGRSVHPITAVVGGFTDEISSADYIELAEAMEAALPFAKRSVELFGGFEVCDIDTAGDMLALTKPGSYPIQDSDTLHFVGTDESFDGDASFEHIERFQVDHSAALFARRASNGAHYMTCSLARINSAWDELGSTAKVASAAGGLRPPERNPFKNNVAQAVEIVDALDRCSTICRELAETSGDSTPVDFEVRAGHAVGVTEAPRGVLMHELELDGEGRVVHASIMTPTAQNLANLEDDIRLLATSLAASGTDEAAIKLEIEKLIRAYDPCLSCSVH